MVIYQVNPTDYDTDLDMVEFQSMDNTTTVPAAASCLAPPPLGTPNPLPMPNEQTDGGAFHVLDGEEWNGTLAETRGDC